ncbi:MAG: SsrA-binding protein, SsrA-binding protein [Microgenomates group bacterium GW2011_GWC1_46_16]|uniref:SsrA-binding protein n=2 Tax=Candidatus Collieribacteriota TaxID=1752725 RepID=A0A1F5FXS2_9BACT|nr:MAG: SsrA-binding protein, SsrA-binding protein [Microgenomates group bacterium GW2011_GWC1_46_16]KKU27894.1 MAG: SsrA-binding protein [Microgenomates group bacterium GW2011_GWF2_46_18]KKU62785.1 MAG: SsrA-binding protein [Microgenomates group bacterium GW2011_GWD1_47_13]OGD70937.1 MAG: SsrA-binding protein [Candidatus Collierbacteria bacterium RIFOXYA1_FULL_46_24]OGD74401.1 MAG: SsrA-binding protein [Candidatus Collierbacteria bacterium RIFOXYA2_FULL_46_10]OGD84409.1 MAG: SsrA-binding prot
MIINKLAKREYAITDTYVAGVVLTGAEVKSLRGGRGSLRDGYVKLINGELYLVGADLPQYSHYSGKEYDAKRSRKLLMKAKEILKIQQQIEGKPLTLVPLRLFFQGRWVKCEIGIGKGKKEWEKREDIKKRDVDREMAKAMKN